jgi:protein-S-isoprenylcysteine O-methyltransferase Ste14
VISHSIFMKATNWEFKNRALLFGLIFGATFPLYALDPVNSTTGLANWLALRFNMNSQGLLRILFGCATLLLIVAALIRTWASAYLQADVVYSPELKTQSLVADGPYRYVRNPLYFANVLMAIGMGAMMSRTGFVLVVILMVTFCYRLILREESELQGAHNDQYEQYKNSVPRLIPSLRPHVTSDGRRANWATGFRAESWYWGFAAALLAFTGTLKINVFFAILTVSILLFWGSSWVFQKKSNTQ